MPRIRLSDAIDDLAPPPPPCFLNRLEWVEYLKSCAACQYDNESPKIVLIEGHEPRINYEYPICDDCTQEYSRAMTAIGRCQPLFLRSQDPTTTK